MGALTFSQKMELYKHHFIPREVMEFDHAVTSTGQPQHFNFETDTWQMMLRSRMIWVNLMRRKGISDEDMDKMLNRYYEQKEKSDKHPAFGQLQAMGSPSARNNKISDKNMIRTLMARVKYKKVLPKDMTGIIRKNIPHPPTKQQSMI
jgi:hypothetical protein